MKFPGGERQILLPSTVRVIGQRAIDKAAFKPGWHVSVIAHPDARTFQVLPWRPGGENGAVPPGR